jgi:hypothetical protein
MTIGAVAGQYATLGAAKRKMLAVAITPASVTAVHSRIPAEVSRVFFRDVITGAHRSNMADSLTAPTLPHNTEVPFPAFVKDDGRGGV